MKDCTILLGTFWTILTIGIAAKVLPYYGQHGFILTSPRTLSLGTSNQLHFRRIGNLDPGELNIKVFYKESYNSQNEILLEDQYFQIPEDAPDVIVPLNVKKTDKIYNGRLEIMGTFGNDVISGSDNVTFATPPTNILIIQTDKPFYQPGQTVKFRLLRVNKDLKPFQDNNKIDVYVKDPKGTRLFQFKDIDLKQGMVQYMFPLSNEPAEGQWEIIASTKTDPLDKMDTTVSATFDVKEYALPKFDVSIIFPPYVLTNAELIPIKICANYTYGKPVVGTLHLNASLDNYYYYAPDKKIPVLQREAEINGCYDYVIKVSLIEPYDDKDNRYFYNRNIKVVANVIERGTGVERSVTKILQRQTSPLKLRFKDGQRQNYKPGLPFNGQLVVTNPDDTPAAGEHIEICATKTRKRILAQWWATRTEKICKNYISDDEGNIYFNCVVDNIDVISINIVAKSIDYVGGSKSGRREDSLTQPQTQVNLSPFFSPSGNFIQIQPMPLPLHCGSQATLQILFTANDDEDFQFYYQITRQRDLIAAGTVNKHFYAQDDVSRVYQNDAYIGDPVITLIDPTSEDISSATSEQNDCPGAKDSENYPLMGEIDISIDVDYNLSPVFYFLVYYIRNDREIVADSIRIDVEPCFKNKVDFAFRDKVKQVSLPTSVQITASPNSLCGIRAVDKGVTLLNNNNELTKDNIFEKLRNLDRNEYYTRDPCNVNHIQPGLERSAYRRIIIPRPPSFKSSPYLDALSSFQTSGFVVISDFLLFSRPCIGGGSYPTPYYDAARPTAFGKMRHGHAGGEMAVSADNDMESVKEVRDYFPETWLFELEMTGPDGKFVANKQLPDTVTEWEGSAICINSKDGLGISNTTSIRGFQSFFIDYTLPVSVIRGEKFVLIVSVFNYANVPLPIKISLANSGGFEVINPIDGVYCVEPGTSLNLKITLKATKVGKVDITVLAETSDSREVCRNVYDPSVYARDSITKSIDVEAEGFPAKGVVSALICLSDESIYAGIGRRVPNDVIPDSFRAFVDFTGNVLGQTINNLDNLVPLPTGCGEQNMVKFTPVVVLLNYLKNTNMLTEEFKSKAISNLNTGYQKEQNYRRDDGSFSVFGDADSQGSMFLTAFVLQSFYQAKEYIYIDDDVLDKAENWIKERQTDGCFQNVGQIIDIGFEGGVDNDKSLGSITAYVLASLIISKYQNETVKEGAFSCLQKNPPSNPYSQLLYAYTYALAGKTSQAKKYIDQARQKINNEDDMESFIIVKGTQAMNIEAVSYAVLSTLSVGGTSSEVLPYIRYLTSHLNPNGGFISTQDTCVGIAALAMFAKPIYKDPVNVEVITTGSLEETVHITEANKLVVHRFKLPNEPGVVSYTATGTGCCLIQQTILYNTKTPPEKTKFALDVKGTCSFSGCKRSTIKIRASYLPSGQKSGMSILEIKLISGFVADKDSLNQLKSDKRNNILSVAVQNNMVIIYFSEFSNTVSEFSFQIVQVVNVPNAQPGTAKLYDYYAPENSAETSYIIQGFNSDINTNENGSNSVRVGDV